MKNNFYLNKPFCNIFEQPNKLSKKSSQILYGEKFKILSKKKGWIKIKTSFDNYRGFIKKNRFKNNFVPSSLISQTSKGAFSSLTLAKSKSLCQVSI